MKKSIKGNLLIILINFFTTICLYELVSQNKDKYLEIELPPVETISTLTPKKLSETSYDVVVVDKKEIKNRGFSNISEIVQSISGGFSRLTGNKGSVASPALRGTIAPHTLVLVDGKRVNIPGLGQADLNKIPVQIEDIEKVEILRGSSSALYGAEAIGGVINIITKKPQKNYIYIDSYLGTYNTYHKEISATLRKNKIGISLGLTHENSDGFRTNSEYEQKSIHSKLSYFINDNSTLTFNFDTFVNDSGSPGPVNFPDPTANLSHLETLTGINFDSDTLKANLYFHSTHINSISASSNTSSRNFVYTFDVQKKFAIRENINLITGLELSNEIFNSINFNTPANSIGRRTRGKIGIFNQADWNINSYTELISGARYDNIGGKEQLSPRISVNFKTSESTIIGINYGHGFRTPTFNDLFFNSPFFVGNPNLRPEVSDEYEVVFKYFGTRLNSKINIFYRSLRDLITFVPKSPPPSTVENVQKTATFGIGIDNFLKLKQVDVGISYDFFDAENKTNKTKIRLAPRQIFKPYITWYITDTTTLSLQYYIIQQFVVVTGDPSTYDNLDIKLSKKIKVKNTEGEVYLMGKNIMDRDYQFNPGFPVPGAQIFIGASVQF